MRQDSRSKFEWFLSSPFSPKSCRDLLWEIVCPFEASTPSSPERDISSVKKKSLFLWGCHPLTRKSDILSPISPSPKREGKEEKDTQELGGIISCTRWVWETRCFCPEIRPRALVAPPPRLNLGKMPPHNDSAKKIIFLGSNFPWNFRCFSPSSCFLKGEKS